MKNPARNRNSVFGDAAAVKRAAAVILLAGLLVCLGSSTSFAQMRKDVSVVKGRLTDVDHKKNQISVWDYNSKSVQLFVVDTVLIKTLQKDLEVLVFFKNGSKVVKNVKVLASIIPKK